MRFLLIDLHEGEDCPIVRSDRLTDIFEFVAHQETNTACNPYPPGRVLQVLRVNDLLSTLEEMPTYEVMFTLVRGGAA